MRIEILQLCVVTGKTYLERKKNTKVDEKQK